MAPPADGYPVGALLVEPSPFMTEPVDVMLTAYRIGAGAHDGDFTIRVKVGARIVGSWLEQRTGVVVVLVADPSEAR